MVRQLQIIIPLLLSLTFSSVSSSFAQQGKDEYTKATALFEAEEYEAALPFFETAYELSGKRPSTILGLAQCERALKLYERAITHFEEYLKTNPEKEQALRVEETLRLTRIILKSTAQIKHSPAPQQPQSVSAEPTTSLERRTQDSGSVWRSPWLWVVVGTVAIAGGIGSAFAIQGDTEAYRGNTNVVLQPLIRR